MKPFLFARISFLFLALSLSYVVNCQQKAEVSNCITTVNNLYDIRELIPLANGNSLQIRLKHGLGKAAVVIEKLNDSLRVIDKRQIVLRGDFINFFTYDFKDIEVLVNDDYCYLLLCERNKEVLSLHASAIQIANLEDLSESRIIAKMNKGKIYNTNIRQPFDGYFSAILDKYANLMITSVESREDVFKKKTSKKELEVKVCHAFFDCELNRLWETSERQSYFSEFEILPGAVNSDGHYFFLTKNSPADISYRYNFVLVVLEASTGEVLNRTRIISSEDRYVNEIAVFNSLHHTYLAGSYYRENHRASSGILIGKLDLSEDLGDSINLTFHDYSTEEIIEASYFNSSEIAKILSKDNLAEIPHFTVENVIELENAPLAVGRFITKKASHHFRHQYFENFEGRNRDVGNKESLSGGTLGLFQFNEELNYEWGKFVCRSLYLPVGYMKTISLIENNKFHLIYADNTSSSVNEKYPVHSSKNLSLFRLSLNPTEGIPLEVTSLKTSKDFSFMLNSGENSFRNNAVIFQTIKRQEDCIRICRIDL